MAGNTNLHSAKKAKNDEFYTQLTDVANELKYYRPHFAGKTVFCNCDDPTWSAFWKYFHLNFSVLGIKKLVSTHYDKNAPTYKMEYEGGDDDNIEAGVITPLEGNGDFRNQECLDLLDECDIVVTNPPFSLFREYVKTLMEHGKKFLIIGNMNAITYKEIFPLIKDNQLWLGHRSLNRDMYFAVPPERQKWMAENKKEGSAYKVIDGVVMGRLASACWFTNLDHARRHELLDLRGNKYYGNEDLYPRYDNYDAINVDSVEGTSIKPGIPGDYDGVMGVPITFLGKYCPEQFEIVVFRHGDDGKDLVFTRKRERGSSTVFSRPCPAAAGGLITGTKRTICRCGKSAYAGAVMRRMMRSSLPITFAAILS